MLAGQPEKTLLNRLDIATIVIGFDGVVVYANPACERLLGYQAATSLEGRPLATLVAGQSESASKDWIELLRNPETVINWNHSDGYLVATLASSAEILRTADQMLMVSLTDVSDRVWSELDTAIRYCQRGGE